MGTPSFCSIDGDTTNQSIGASYLDISDAVQAEQARRFLDPVSLPPIPENSDATEKARQSSEQLAQVTQTSQKPRWIIPGIISYTPGGYVGPALVAGCEGSTKGEPLTVGCDGWDYYDIHLAIDAASDGDTIEVCDGTYTGFRVEYKSLTIKAKEGHFPIIELDDDNTYPNVFFYGVDQFTLSGFEIYGSDIYNAINGEDSNIVDLSDLIIHNTGGGIRIEDGSYYDSLNVSISDSVIYDGTYWGIDIALTATPSIINLNNVEIYNIEGSGIIIFGLMSYESPPSLIASNLNVHDNNASSYVYEDDTSIYDGTYFGGGISLFSAEASISNSIFTDNYGYHGAAFYVRSSTLTLTDTTVKDNIAINPNGIGGALQLMGGWANVTANNTNWDGNIPYDISVQNTTDTTLNTDYVFDYGISSNFECEYKVGCTDL